MCQKWLHVYNTCFKTCPGMGSFQVLTFNIQNSQLSCLFSSTCLLYIFILSLSLQMVHFSPILRVDMATLTGLHPPHTHTKVRGNEKHGFRRTDPLMGDCSALNPRVSCLSSFIYISGLTKQICDKNSF